MRFRIVATDTGVAQPFYAGVDCDDALVWVDLTHHAVDFDTRADAEDFGHVRIAGGFWKVIPAC